MVASEVPIIPLKRRISEDPKGRDVQWDDLLCFNNPTCSPDVERAAKKAEILKRAKVWAVPFVGGSEWASSEVREEARERKILCIVDGKVEPSRDNWEQLEQTLAFWKPKSVRQSSYPHRQSATNESAKPSQLIKFAPFAPMSAKVVLKP